MRHVQDWASLSPQQQFDILKSARENVDAALIKRGVFDPTGKRIVSKVSDADSTLLNVRGEINTLLKTSEDMIDNDTTYAAFKGIDNLISSVSVRNPETKEFVIVPERLRDLFKDTKSGGELRLRLDLADQVADKLPAEEAKLVKDALASIKQSLEVAKQQKDLQTIYKNAAKFKKSEVRGLEAFFGEGQLPVIGVTDPKQMTQVYSRLTEFAKKYLNSDSFDKLSAKEKQALLMLEAQVRQKKMI
jgi:hypothetical protein